MDISVIVPAYNEEKYIGACLEHILKHAPQDLLEIIVIDNSSSDRTAEIAKAYPKVRVVKEPQKGLLFARQRGLLEARGELLAYVDADTHVRPGWFEVISREFARDSRVVCISGPYYYYDASRWQKALIWIYWNYLAFLAYRIVGYMVVGGNFTAKKAALNKIGGFDTTIAFYGEDNDVARRLHAIGKVRYLRSLVALTSSRRLRHEGFWHMAVKYTANFVWVAAFHRPFSESYKDPR